MAHGGVVVRVSSEHQHRPAHDHRRVEVPEEAAVPQDGPAQRHGERSSTSDTQRHPNGASPSPSVHVKLVQVSRQAVLVGADGLVAAVDVDRPGAGVENAAVAVAALDQRAVGGHQVPRVLGWVGVGGQRTSFR